MPSLTELIHASGLSAEISPEAARADIHAITADSRQVAPGTAFVAVPGVKADGKTFIGQALKAGASAIISDGYHAEGDPWVIVTNARAALAKLASAFYPRQPAHIAAVTGTDGKTSTAEFYRQLASLLGHRSASIGTLGTLGDNRRELAPGLNTTPDPVGLHKMLSDLAEGGYTHVCMEASSHGLDQHRLDGVKVEAAAFTNITRDHLDYHGTEEAYFAAKQRLFTELLKSGGTAVLNADDTASVALAESLRSRSQRLLTFGKAGKDYRIVSLTPSLTGQRAELLVHGRSVSFELPHVGAFQVYNMLSALGLIAATGGDEDKALHLFPKLTGVPGRLEQVAMHPAGAPVFIDYAHTPAALANVLRTLKAHTENRLVVVFGCGGDRDRGKRPQMARAASELADLVIVTDDNPRSEDPAAIRAEVMTGAPTAKEVAGRGEAIYGAVKLLKRGDVLLVAGKGHEKTQIIGNVTHAFDDAQVIREAVAGL